MPRLLRTKVSAQFLARARTPMLLLVLQQELADTVLERLEWNAQLFACSHGVGALLCYGTLVQLAVRRAATRN